MTWNIFKRIAQLEQQVKDLTDFNGDNNRWFLRLEERVTKLEKANQVLVNSNQALIGRHENIGKRLQNLEHQVYMQSRQLNHAAPVHSEGEPVFTEVDKEREKKRKYQREWYAKKRAKAKQEKNAQAAREKKNAYYRAYYARKKAEAK